MASKRASRIQSTRQFQAFKDAARALECDESEAVFDKALGKIGRASVPRKPSKRALKATQSDSEPR